MAHGPSAGFTLLEALVSVFILALLSSILLVGSYAARRQAAVRSATHEVAGFVRESRNLALNGVKDPQCLQDSSEACSVYWVAFQGRPFNRNERATFPRGYGGTVRILPAATEFTHYGRKIDAIFLYDPPRIFVNPGGEPPRSYPPPPVCIRHRADHGIVWQVRIAGNGGVEVRAGSEGCEIDPDPDP